MSVLVESIELRLVGIPMTRSLRTSTGVMENSKTTVIVVLRTSEGLKGFGESAAQGSPTYSEETSYTCYEVLRRHLCPRVLGRAVFSVGEFVDGYRDVRGNQFAKSGLEAAFWDVLSQQSGVGMKTLMGGTRHEVEVGEAIGICDSVDALLAEVDARLREGYKRVKLKIQPGWDLEPVRAVRGAFPECRLMVDANGAYHLSDSRVFAQLDSLNLMMIEQPLGYADIVDHAALQRQLATPICLDESIRSLEGARQALQIGACGVINVKPGRVGGVLEAIRIHDLCMAWGVPAWVGGMMESGIGRASNICVASLPAFSLPADMSPASMYFESDLVEPTFAVEEGIVQVPEGIGLGFEVAEARLQAYTLASTTVTE